MTWQPFNINSRVRVKLTERGRQIHLQNHADLVAYWNYLDLSYTPPEEDADGWSVWQLWELCRVFGPHITMGLDLPFETEIELSREVES